MPQEVQQSQTNETKLTTVTNKMKTEQKQNKNEDTARSLKRTAPTDVAGQGDAKRKATQGSKKSEKAIEGANIKSDPTMLAANAAAILSSVPPSVAQNVVGQSTESTNPPFDNVLNATYSINSTNSPIAVAPLISNQQPTTINDISPMLHSDMGELMDSSAIHEASQDNSGNKRAVSTRNLTNDERRQRRLLRNRVAAKECRRKKKAYVADLEEKVTRLEEENLRLLKEVEDFNTKLNINALKLEENARLHKEVEELKAKLRHEAQKEKRLKSHDEIEPTKQEATS